MLIFYVVLGMAIVAGCIFLAKSKAPTHLTVLSAAIAAALLAPWGVYSITAAVAKSHDQTFYEYWNGSETATRLSAIACERDGRCTHTYDCDPYEVTSTENYTDSEGKRKTREVKETKYHSCPYSHEETTYTVETTLGPFVAGKSLMTGEQYRWGKSIPGGRQSAPALWVEAKNRIDSGNPSGVTSRNKYKNYILSADVTLLKNYSDMIEEFEEDGLLPTPVSEVHSLYQANKAYSVGETGVDMASMNRQLTQLNAFAGSELRADTHVVFAEASKVGDPTDYTNALKGYWSSEKVGKNAIAKNTVTLVVGVEQKDGKPVVKWATGFTGMPVGNEGLLQEFTNLKGTVIDGNFIGSPKFNLSSKTYELSGGKLESMISGEHKFSRVSMSADDKDDTGSGFSYLSESWHMKPAQLAIAISISSIVSVIILLIGKTMSDSMANTRGTRYGNRGPSYRDPVGDFIDNFSKN